MRENFFRDLILDPLLSWKAKGIAFAIMTHPDVFGDENIKDKRQFVIDHGRDGMGAVKSALKELRGCGLLKSTNIHKSTGRRFVVGVRWEIVEKESVDA